MKKIYSVANGRFVLIVFGLGMIFSTTILLILLLTNGLEWLYPMILLAVVFIVLIIIHIFKYKCLNYIKISSNEVEHKNINYSWNDVYITMDLVNAFGGRAYRYRIFFSGDFLTKEEIRKANKKGFWIDITKNRINCILSYYNKQICDLYEYPNPKGIYKIIIEHNQVICEQKDK